MDQDVLHLSPPLCPKRTWKFSRLQVLVPGEAGLLRAEFGKSRKDQSFLQLQ